MEIMSHVLLPKYFQGHGVCYFHGISIKYSIWSIWQDTSHPKVFPRADKKYFQRHATGISMRYSHWKLLSVSEKMILFPTAFPPIGSNMAWKKIQILAVILERNVGES